MTSFDSIGPTDVWIVNSQDPRESRDGTNDGATFIGILWTRSVPIGMGNGHKAMELWGGGCPC